MMKAGSRALMEFERKDNQAPEKMGRDATATYAFNHKPVVIYIAP